MKRTLSVFGLIIFHVLIFGQKTMTDKTLVENFDINQYLGTWYEIARYDHSFEKDLVGVTARYNILENGKITVINSGYKKTLQGNFSQAKGKAKIAKGNNPAHLKVSFFLFFYADYYVFEIGDNYQWAVVGSKSDKYLWILSRKPYLPSPLYNSILKRITKRGYNTDGLIRVQHNMDNYVELPSL